MFVSKEFRNQGIAWKLFSEVCKEAEKLGIKNIVTSACSDANNVTDSIKVILSAGFQLTKISGNMMYFLKEL
jgi:L-amino acid N-acyltransferase YncA